MYLESSAIISLIASSILNSYGATPLEGKQPCYSEFTGLGGSAMGYVPRHDIAIL